MLMMLSMQMQQQMQQNSMQLQMFQQQMQMQMAAIEKRAKQSEEYLRQITRSLCDNKHKWGLTNNDEDSSDED
jgi:hypothetical protein